ncbi:MAG: sigma-70 family RNA polymerase sigma factor [Phycisphaeraceae bacterium]|nr:MAG: sigma-70 family RNA polymerase sigma factor [Phycisphaeraceae bacterium]
MQTPPNPAADSNAPAARLIAEFAPRLYRYALVRLGRVDRAEDAVAEVLCRLVEKGPPLDGPTAHIHGWCVRCMVNVCREEGRRGWRGDGSHQPSAIGRQFSANLQEPTPDDQPSYRFADHVSRLPDSAEVRSMVEALGHLSERQAEAVILRVLMGLPVAACAAAMNCAEGTVKALTHQGLASLRLRLAHLAAERNAGGAS